MAWIMGPGITEGACVYTLPRTAGQQSLTWDLDSIEPPN